MVSTNTVSTNSNLLMVSAVLISTKSFHHKRTEYTVLVSTNSAAQTVLHKCSQHKQYSY